jgi:hypothetical protein
MLFDGEIDDEDATELISHVAAHPNPGVREQIAAIVAACGDR